MIEKSRCIGMYMEIILCSEGIEVLSPYQL